MNKEKNTPTQVPLDDFEASLKAIMERLRRQAEEIAQLRDELDEVRSSATVVANAPDRQRSKNDSES